jgi:hypothetical protein
MLSRLILLLPCVLGCTTTDPDFIPTEVPFDPGATWELVENPYNQFSAVALVTVETECDVRIEYSSTLDVALEDSGFTPDFPLDNDVPEEIVVLGLKAGRAYDLQIVATAPDGRTWESGFTGTHTTLEMPSTWEGCEATSQDGFDLEGVICTGTGENTHPFYFFCVDRTGEVVWAISRPDQNHMMYLEPLDDGTFAAVGCYDYIAYFDEWGDLTGELPGSDLQPADLRFDHSFIDHHEVIEITEGQWRGAVALLTRAYDVFEGEDKGGAGIVVLYPDSGTVMWDWTCHGERGDGVPIDPKLDYSRETLLDDGMGGDFHHANTLVHEVEEDGREYFWVSLRNQDWIIKVDVATDEVVWRLGYEGDFDLVEDLDGGSPASSEEWFFHQHRPVILNVGTDGRKDVLIYDNGTVRVTDGGLASTLNPYSRVITLKIDEDSMRAAVIFDYGPGPGQEGHWWTGIYGNASMLPEQEAVVFTQGNYPILVDVSYPEGEERWRYSCPSGSFYRVDYYPSLYEMDWVYPGDS